jgi:hypothetical protein
MIQKPELVAYPVEHDRQGEVSGEPVAKPAQRAGSYFLTPQARNDQSGYGSIP